MSTPGVAETLFTMDTSALLSAISGLLGLAVPLLGLVLALQIALRIVRGVYRAVEGSSGPLYHPPLQGAILDAELSKRSLAEVSAEVDAALAALPSTHEDDRPLWPDLSGAEGARDE